MTSPGERNATYAPLGLLAELTHRCPLGCPYCSNPVALEPRKGELDTATWARVFREAAALGVLQVHLSGGEPGARRDLVDIVAAARAADLYGNLITSGVGITEATLAKLADAGLDHVQISIQDSIPASADVIAGYTGAFARKNALARAVVRLGLPLTVNVVVHRANIERVGAMVELALELGASRVEIAHVQYYGWALANRAMLDAGARAGGACGGRGRRAAAAPSRAHRHRRCRPGLLRALSEAVRRRLGPALAQRDSIRQGAAVPRGRNHPRPHVLERHRARTRGHLAELTGVPRFPRNRLDARTLRKLCTPRH